MRRIVRLVIALSVLAGVVAPTTFAAQRMWVGFHDDPSFRWLMPSERRQALFASSAQNNASVIRLLVQWNLAAKTRPANAVRPVRPVVRVRRRRRGRSRGTAERPRGDPDGLGDAEVGERRQDPERHAHAGLRLHRLRTCDRVAILGPLRGLPVRAVLLDLERAQPAGVPDAPVRPRGRSVAPANYAKLAAAAYSGIKAGSPRSLVAIGETSARGSDKATGIRPIHSPGKFAELVAKANPKLKFDAWSHHPYPSVPSSPPSQVVKWPNVSLASLPSFDASLKTWFKRKSVPIWVTEYGHQTRPEDSLGVPYATAGEVHPAGDFDLGRLPVRQHVHLVRVPGRPGSAVGFRASTPAPAHRRARRPPVSRRALGRSTRVTGSSHFLAARSHRW